MNQGDFKAFTALLDGTCALLSRGAYTPNPTSAAIFFNAVKHHDMATVSAGFEAHCRDPQRGRFAPTPADILAQIEHAAAADGRPEDAEAWATALRGSDEAATVVWTSETAESWGICKPVLDAGDEVGARMAFKAAYNRLVGAARSLREPIRWAASIGHDAAQRDDVLRASVGSGRLPMACLPAPIGPIAGLLELSQQRECPPMVRARLLEIRAQITSPRGEYMSQDAQNKKRTDALKEELSRRVKGGNNGAV